MVANQNVLNRKAELSIHIKADKEARTLIIEDTGIGMTKRRSSRTLGRLLDLGARKFLEATKDQKTDLSESLVSSVWHLFRLYGGDWVRVTSRSYQSDAEAVSWYATGEDNYQVGAADMS